MGVVHIPAPSCAFTDIPLLFWVMSPRDVFPSCVVVPSSQQVSTVVQIAFFGNARDGCVRRCGMGVVHIPAPSCALADLPFSLGLCLPQHAFLPCYGSFVAAREFGWSNGVFRQCMPGLCEGLWHGCGAHTCPILCTC